MERLCVKNSKNQGCTICFATCRLKNNNYMVKNNKLKKCCNDFQINERYRRLKWISILKIKEIIFKTTFKKIPIAKTTHLRKRKEKNIKYNEAKKIKQHYQKFIDRTYDVLEEE